MSSAGDGRRRAPQLFAGLAGAIVRRLKRAPLLHEVRDLWPDSLVAVQVNAGGIWLRILRGIDRFLVGYVGTHGLRDGLESEIEAARMLKYVEASLKVGRCSQKQAFDNGRPLLYIQINRI